MVAEVEATARGYDTPAEVFPDMGHEMILETGWQAAVDPVCRVGRRPCECSVR